MKDMSVVFSFGGGLECGERCAGDWESFTTVYEWLTV